MSASKKKQARKGTDETLQQNTPQETRSHGALYAVAGAIVVIVVAAVLIWNSNFFQNRAAAVTINGVEYSAADVNYYYFNNAQSGAYYYSMMGLYDPAKAPEDQIFEESSGMTWRDYFLEQSIENLRQEVALAAEAEKAGMTLSEENLATIEQAKLELEDENDILGCGIEIKAQPPGKTLKTISLLSGGEKAFVAIALYFSILKVHPTPFCVMDEIEAALDDANVTRYARYMRGLAGKTQFIVITHRRGTMEEADVLYGVTMQEQGVSRMLTINLNDVEKELNIR